MAESQKKVRVSDIPTITPVYCNRFISAAFDGGAIGITLGETRMVTEYIDQGPKQGEHPTVYVTARLALSPSAAIELIKSLNNLLQHVAAVANQTPPPMAPGSTAQN